MYRYWFETWRAAGGGLFAHYADIGFPGRYGSWGVVSYLGHDKVPGNPAYRLNELHRQNERGVWWKTERAANAFLQGLWLRGGGVLTGSVKADVLVGTGNRNRLDGGSGDDVLAAIAGQSTVEASDGDDRILISSAADVVDGGAGMDPVKPAMGLASLDLSVLKAVNIEVVDTRNAARTDLRVTPGDVRRLTGGRHLAVFAETKDDIRTSGFRRTRAEAGAVWYAGSAGGEAVTLSVTTDIAVR